MLSTYPSFTYPYQSIYFTYPGVAGATLGRPPRSPVVPDGGQRSLLEVPTNEEAGPLSSQPLPRMLGACKAQ